MTAVPKKKLTFEEFYALDQADPWKNEFCEGVMTPMIHPSRNHHAIMSRLVYGIGMSIQDTPYCSYSSRMRVFFPATGLYTFPDMLIVPRSIECVGENRDIAINPQVLVEVLTAESELRDRRTMHQHYMKDPSVREIVLVADDEPRIEQYKRTNGGEWRTTLYTSLSETLSLKTVRAELPLADIYSDLDMPADSLLLGRDS